MKRIDWSQRQGSGVALNMSPLIDCIFLLLIFFIVTSVFVDDTAVDISRPRAASAADVERQSLFLTLDGTGNIRHSGRDVPLSGVRALVVDQMSALPKPVVILADASTRTDSLIELIDECRLAGAKQVSVAARREQRESMP